MRGPSPGHPVASCDGGAGGRDRTVCHQGMCGKGGDSLGKCCAMAPSSPWASPAIECWWVLGLGALRVLASHGQVPRGAGRFWDLKLRHTVPLQSPHRDRLGAAPAQVPSPQCGPSRCCGWLWLAAAAASLLCPNGQPCPVAPSLPMFSANSVRDSAGTVCQDGSRCPAEYSCLPTISGTFGCCPLAESVSCAGGLHCCPQGSHCSADSKFCFAHPALGAIQCPDGESECPDNSTCCMMPSGAWGCCPMPEASCCADKVHCCPHATICDLAHGRCLTPTGELPLGNKFPAWKRQSQPSAPVALSQVTCPDGQSACPDGTTCCQLPSAQYGCCPLQNAVCCSDHLHCCPQGTTCDLERSKCASGKGWVKLLTRLSTTPTAACDVKCDEEKSCPDGSTCCRLSSGAWGCCPLEQVAIRVPWQEKMPARARGREVKCDEEKSCPDGSTCCRLSSGAWGCCPLEQAVCCPDHVHCCPQGYTCDPEGSSCLQGGIRVPWQEKMPARARGREVKCDEEKSCPDGSTCCRLSSGAWGCCPLEQAVCCPDHVHCCPQGYTCDPEGSSCLQGGIRVPWAVCCSDGFHCCPLGYTCDLAQGRCHKEQLVMPWVAKMPATRRGQAVKCNATASCADGQTCCKSQSGDWACCQLPSAVCCKDHQHCCPWGYTCNVVAQSCEKQRAPALTQATAASPVPLSPATPPPSEITAMQRH
nr:PREDICTED: granulins [Struthio camelus australis]